MIKFFLFFIVLISMILKISIKQIYDFECGSRSDWIRIGNGVVFYFILFPYLRITFFCNILILCFGNKTKLCDDLKKLITTV